MSAQSNDHRPRATRRPIAVAGLWALMTTSACDDGAKTSTASSVSSVASRAPGLHERALSSPAQPAGGVRFDEAMEAYKRFEKACRDKDAHALWNALAPGGQSDVAERMKVLYELADSKEQERLSSLDGEPDVFSPQEYLISQFGQPKSVCPSGAWTLTNKQEYHQLFLMVRHVGKACEGLWVARNDGKLGVFPAGWYDPCPEEPAANVIDDMGERGRKLREQQAKADEDKGEPVTPAQVKEAYEAYTKACKAKDFDAMWALLPERSRQGLAKTALNYHDREGAALLKESGWSGDVSSYDARAHFEHRLDDTRFCPVGTSWQVLASSSARASPGWLVVKTTGSDRDRCDVLDVTLEQGSLRIRSREGWFSTCPPATSIVELVSKK